MTAAGVIRRVLARCVDEVIVGLCWLTGALWLGLVARAAGRAPADLWVLVLLTAVGLSLGLALRVIYFVGFVGGCGQTPGKTLLGVRVVRRDGIPVGYGRAAARWLAHGLVWATLGLGFLAAALRADRRGLHDWVTGTRVVRA